MSEKLTQEELLRQLDEMTGRRYMDFPWSVRDRQAYDQLKEIVKFYFSISDKPKEGYMKISDHPDIPFMKELEQQRPTVTREFLSKVINFIENKGWRSLEGGWHLKMDGEIIDGVAEMIEEELDMELVDD